jgi:hypothetical protein
MMCIKLSPNRALFIDEYWILIPLMFAIDMAIIVKVNKNRAEKKRKLEQLKKKWNVLKIFHIATGNIIAALQVRAGENVAVGLVEVEGYNEVRNPNCIVGKGFRFVNNERIRKIAYSLFKSKAKNGVIYITKSALCHLVKIYGLYLPALPVPIPDFIGVSGWYQLVRKIISVGCLGIPLPMLILAQGPISIIFSIVAAGFGIVVMAYTKDPGFLIIPTSVISTSIESITRRIPDQPDIISIDLEPVSRSKIIMPEFSKRYECSLTEQIINNPKCSVRPSEISDIDANAGLFLDYNKVVNMGDVTQLTDTKFTDHFEVSPIPEPTNNFRLRGTHRFKNPGKTVKFLEKFGDPEFISETEQWDISTPTPQDEIRIQDEL